MIRYQDLPSVSNADARKEREKARRQAEDERLRAEREASRKSRSALQAKNEGGRRATLLATDGQAGGPVSSLNVRKQVLGVS